MGTKRGGIHRQHPTAPRRTEPIDPLHHVDWSCLIQYEPGGAYAPTGRIVKRRGPSQEAVMDEIYRSILIEAGAHGKVLNMKFTFLVDGEEHDYEFSAADVERAIGGVGRTMGRRIAGLKN